MVEGDLGGLHGAYMHDHRAILIDWRLGPVQRRSTLAHELGHAYYGPDCSTARTERDASEWAARILIRGCDLVMLSRAHDTPPAVAEELGVLPRDVVNYRSWLLRHGYEVLGSDCP